MSLRGMFKSGKVQTLCKIVKVKLASHGLYIGDFEKRNLQSIGDFKKRDFANSFQSIMF